MRSKIDKLSKSIKKKKKMNVNYTWEIAVGR